MEVRQLRHLESNKGLLEPLGLRIEEHPVLRTLGLQIVRRLAERHSEIVEYHSHLREAPIIIKRITRWKSTPEAEARIQHEYEALCELRKSLSPQLLRTVPEPLAVFPDAKAIVLTKLPGARLSSILKCEANLLTGSLRHARMALLGRLAGNWLFQMHQETRKEAVRFNTDSFLESLDSRLDRCRKLGIAEPVVSGLLGWVEQVAAQMDGCALPAAARQGDFTPQNILVERNQLGIVDFENFASQNPIYEDVATFMAYIVALSTFPYYSRGALRALVQSFAQAYGSKSDEAFLQLYFARALIVLISETNRERLTWYSQQRLALLQGCLVRLCADRKWDPRGAAF